MSNVFQGLLQRFFLKRLIEQKQASPETVKSYRDAFRIYLEYLDAVHRCSPHKVGMEHMEAEYILGFLNYLSSERKNQPATINSRLAAIHAFLRFISFEKPEYSATVQRSLMVPFQKTARRQVDYLTRQEMDALLDVCSVKEALGRRDQMMVLLLYNTGARVSELVSLKHDDIVFDGSGFAGSVRIVGKGRKERTIPLWKTTLSAIRRYSEEHQLQPGDKLFSNFVGGELTRSGVRYRIRRLVEEAQEGMPSLRDKRISPHTFRHSTALHLLQAGVDLSSIAIWLGHENINTTHKYMEADMDMKESILAKLASPSANLSRYKPSRDVLAFLSSL